VVRTIRGWITHASADDVALTRNAFWKRILLTRGEQALKRN
jgi:hypothetical protein